MLNCYVVLLKMQSTVHSNLHLFQYYNFKLAMIWGTACEFYVSDLRFSFYADQACHKDLTCTIRLQGR